MTALEKDFLNGSWLFGCLLSVNQRKTHC